jgi:UDP-N-acetylglucosamine--N-acetylmuramyl-(pentapeptide) pyrophosphoryl-undecaprenol N-acetylglucosamine transferase
VTPELKNKYRQNIKITDKSKLLFVIGGGQGAQSLNEVLVNILPKLLEVFTDLRVIHVAGPTNIDNVNIKYKESLNQEQLSRVEVLSYTDRVYEYSGAADIVVTRAGATNLAEFACQGVACIIVPSTVLVGGHQLKNAKILKDSGAALVVSDKSLEKDPSVLAKEIDSLLRSSEKRQKLAKELRKFAYPDASLKIAKLLINTAEPK